MTGRCFSLTCLPLRQPRRISNLFQFPGDAARVAAISSRRETCGGVRHPTGGRCRIFIPLTKHNQLGGELLREGAQRLPGVACVHVSNMEHPNAESVASAYVNARS